MSYAQKHKEAEFDFVCNRPMASIHLLSPLFQLHFSSPQRLDKLLNVLLKALLVTHLPLLGRLHELRYNDASELCFQGI